MIPVSLSRFLKPLFTGPLPEVPASNWLLQPGIVGPRMTVAPEVPGSCRPLDAAGPLCKWVPPPGAELIVLGTFDAGPNPPHYYLLRQPGQPFHFLEWQLSADGPGTCAFQSRLAIVPLRTVPPALRTLEHLQEAAAAMLEDGEIDPRFLTESTADPAEAAPVADPLALR